MSSFSNLIELPKGFIMHVFPRVVGSKKDWLAIEL